uniref:RPN1_RPN2_N domain-containing protein n=1 Tax=Gongylonema pulchrum TaxID=637853 RepID=A0A183ETX0_9BILA
LEQKQMAILLGRHQIFLDLEGVPKAEKLIELNSNTHLHTYFHSLARELDIMEPKTPEAIYKSHLEQSHALEFYNGLMLPVVFADQWQRCPIRDYSEDSAKKKVACHGAWLYMADEIENAVKVGARHCRLHLCMLESSEY